MKKVFCMVLFSTQLLGVTAQPGWQLLKTFSIKSNGGWDYLSVNGQELYVSHGMQVNILNKTTGDSVDVLLNTPGVHGIAFIPKSGKGYTSNGRANTVTVFDLTSHKVLQQIPVGQNPDAIYFDSFTGKIITCNGRSKDLSVIDPVTDTVIATIAVGGKPETLVSDEAGKWFVNNEDKNSIEVVDAVNFSLVQHWPISPGEAPTGLAIDKQTHRLFAGCDNKMLAVIDSKTGRLLQEVPIGDGCDGVAFDEKWRLVFTSNGEGTMSVINEDKQGVCTLMSTVTTSRGARTIALDAATHWLYLPTADFEPLPADAKEGTRPKMVAGSFKVLVIGNKL